MKYSPNSKAACMFFSVFKWTSGSQKLTDVQKNFDFTDLCHGGIRSTSLFLAAAFQAEIVLPRLQEPLAGPQQVPVAGHLFSCRPNPQILLSNALPLSTIMKNGHHYAAPIAFGFTTSQPMELPAFKLGVVSSPLSCWLFRTSAQRSWSSLRILRISIAVDDVLDGPPTFAQFLSCCGHKLLLSLRLLSHPRRLKVATSPVIMAHMGQTSQVGNTKSPA